VSVQLPLHSTSGALQAQSPVTQSSSESQAVPQAPQLRRSLLTSWQRPLQKAWPAGHAVEQAPPWHTEPAAQTRPHAPQFASSVESSAQRPAQVVSPSAQPVAPA
jgi:hypothetical protein